MTRRKEEYGAVRRYRGVARGLTRRRRGRVLPKRSRGGKRRAKKRERRRAEGRGKEGKRGKANGGYRGRRVGRRYEVSGVEEKRAKRALEKAGKKRPIRTKRVERKWSR